MESLPPPGEFAKVDDQGTQRVCAFNALSKANCQGLMTKKFVPGQQVDVGQDVMTNLLLNQFPVSKHVPCV